jgi:hypothetical protein
MTAPDQQPDFPDIDVPDDGLTGSQRQQVKDLAQRIIDAGGNAPLQDELNGLPRGLRRRAMNRYQSFFEDSESRRAKNAAARADDDNGQATKDAAQLARQAARQADRGRTRKVLVVPIEEGVTEWDKSSVVEVESQEPVVPQG